MPIHGWFDKRDDRKLTMPRVDEGTPDAIGIIFHGDILTGKISLQDYFKREAARFSQTHPGECADPRDYDPVLKFHLGIK